MRGQGRNWSVQGAVRYELACFPSPRCPQSKRTPHPGTQSHSMAPPWLLPLPADFTVPSTRQECPTLTLSSVLTLPLPKEGPEARGNAASSTAGGPSLRAESLGPWPHQRAFQTCYSSSCPRATATSSGQEDVRLCFPAPPQPSTQQCVLNT